MAEVMLSNGSEGVLPLLLLPRSKSSLVGEAIIQSVDGRFAYTYVLHRDCQVRTYDYLKDKIYIDEIIGKSLFVTRRVAIVDIRVLACAEDVTISWH